MRAQINRKAGNENCFLAQAFNALPSSSYIAGGVLAKNSASIPLTARPLSAIDTSA